jgi:hypothetical protein
VAASAIAQQSREPHRASTAKAAGTATAGQKPLSRIASREREMDRIA